MVHVPVHSNLGFCTSSHRLNFKGDLHYSAKSCWDRFEQRKLLWCLNRCQKWTLYKILHRSWCSKKIITHNFSTKNIILKTEKIFFCNIWQHLKFYHTKIFFPLKNEKYRVRRYLGGVGVQNGRMVEKTSEMDSLVPLSMLINFLGQPITNIDLSSIFITRGGTWQVPPPLFRTVVILSFKQVRKQW